MRILVNELLCVFGGFYVLNLNIAMWGVGIICLILQRTPCIPEYAMTYIRKIFQTLFKTLLDYSPLQYMAMWAAHVSDRTSEDTKDKKKSALKSHYDTYWEHLGNTGKAIEFFKFIGMLVFRTVQLMMAPALVYLSISCMVIHLIFYWPFRWAQGPSKDKTEDTTKPTNRCSQQ